MVRDTKRVRAIFYRSSTGAEPVRTWLKSLPEADRKIVGNDIATVEFGWPVGMPLCRSIGFRKGEDCAAAWLRQEDATDLGQRFGFGNGKEEGSPEMSNKHLGSSFEDYLKEEGALEETTSQAMKRVLAWQVQEAMKPRASA